MPRHKNCLIKEKKNRYCQDAGETIKSSVPLTSLILIPCVLRDLLIVIWPSVGIWLQWNDWPCVSTWQRSSLSLWCLSPLISLEGLHSTECGILSSLTRHCAPCSGYVFFWRALSPYFPMVIKAHFEELADLVHRFVLLRESFL